jgi:hypothetical protein
MKFPSEQGLQLLFDCINRFKKRLFGWERGHPARIERV